jgi:hypothetical protein
MKIGIGYGDGGPAGNNNRRYKTGVSELNLSCWYHIVAIFRGPEDMDIFIDGVNDGGTYAGSGGVISYSGCNAHICQNGYDALYLNGTIDEVRQYNKALTADEIQYLYNNPGVGDSVYVDDDYNSSTPGWGITHFDNIQDGVDAVSVNGTVYVFNGTYYENVVVNKSINLIGEDKNNTIIDGGGSGDVVTILNDFIKISRFKIQNSGGGAGINLESNFSIVSDNNITHNNFCIYSTYSNNTEICDNIGCFNGNDITLINSNFNFIFYKNFSLFF